VVKSPGTPDVRRQSGNRTLRKEELALYGGSPVRQTRLPYGRQAIDEEDINAVVSVLRSDWVTQGPKVVEFEEAFARYCGARYGVAFSSGTAGLHAACAAAGLQVGDEAITTPLTFVATANAIVYRGGKPAFADVDAVTLNIDPEEIRKRISEKTKAIIPVHFGGLPCDMGRINEIAKERKLVIIEDACHALGAEIRSPDGWDFIGSCRYSDMTVFSFHPVKHITTGEGGIVTTNDVEMARRLRIFRNHGVDSDARERQTEGQWYYEMVTLGYNYRLTDIGCALGLSQLGRLAGNLARRREIAGSYTEAFKKVPGVIPPPVVSDANPGWHLYSIRLDLARLTVGREEIFRALQAEGLRVNVHYIPVHLHPYYQSTFGYADGEYPIAEEAYERLISLPMFHGMTDDDIEDVKEALNKVLNYYAC
jgi:perosamine synthetase